jgi:hypothetical protein
MTFIDVFAVEVHVMLKQNKPLKSQAMDRNVITLRYKSRFVLCTLFFDGLEIDVTRDSIVL